MGADSGTTDSVRVLVHAQLPIVASVLEDRCAGSRIAAVCIVISRAGSHLGKHLCHGDAGLFVHVATDGGPKTVQDIHDAADEEEVEE